MYLGVDGGQSHTEALVADGNGRIVGRGLGGPSVSTDFTGGEQLARAVREAVGNALGTSDFPAFKAAHFGLTGEFRERKEEIIKSLLSTEELGVGHDSEAALSGALLGRPGVVVIAGTGSVVLGENEEHETARAGGMGYMFSDEGSGFWTAVQTVRLAILERDGVIENSGVHEFVCRHFGTSSVDEVTNGFYSGRLTRDSLASLAKTVQEEVAAGRFAALEYHLDVGARQLADKVRAVAGRLRIRPGFGVAGVGGMFRGKPFHSLFRKHLRSVLPQAEFREAAFGPCVGALLLAYRSCGVEISGDLLENLRESSR